MEEKDISEQIQKTEQEKKRYLVKLIEIERVLRDLTSEDKAVRDAAHKHAEQLSRELRTMNLGPEGGTKLPTPPPTPPPPPTITAAATTTAALTTTTITEPLNIPPLDLSFEYPSFEGDLMPEIIPEKAVAINRMAINKVVNSGGGGGGSTPPHTLLSTLKQSHDEFMSALCKDVRDKSLPGQDKKRKQESESTLWKERGNEEYRKSNFEQAVMYYSKGLELQRENTVLLTNRAQAFIKLRQYDKALEDAGRAIEIFPHSVKAYVHKGKALKGLRKYGEAIECLRQALKVDPKREGTITKYMEDIEQERLIEEREQPRANELVQDPKNNAELVHNWITRLKMGNIDISSTQSILHLLMGVMLEGSAKVAFRSSGGWSLHDHCSPLSKCFETDLEKLSPEELDILYGLINVYTAVCDDDEVNATCLFELPGISDKFMKWLNRDLQELDKLQVGLLNLFFYVSQTPQGRECLVERLSCEQMVQLLMCHITNETGLPVSLLNNLALHDRFRHYVRDKAQQVVVTLVALAMRGEATILRTFITTVTNLLGDLEIRRQMAHEHLTWQAVVVVLESFLRRVENNLEHVETINAVLGMFLNLTTEPTPLLEIYASKALSCCCKALKSPHSKASVQQRAAGVFSHILQNCPRTVEEVVKNEEILTFLLEKIDEKTPRLLLTQVIKIVTICIERTQKMRNLLIEDEEALSNMCCMLRLQEEVMVGNIALCLGYCADTPELCEQLIDTNVIEDLLSLITDSRKSTVRKNACIALAKLATKDTRHLTKLRENNGVEVLQNSMKSISLTP